jgi:hypothetical protein
MKQLSFPAEAGNLRGARSVRRTFRSVPRALVFLVLLSRFAFAAHFVDPKKHWSLNYPDSWHIQQALLDAGGPLVLTTFPSGKYLHGGLLPPGAMEVNIRDFPASTDENAIIISSPPDGVSNVRRSVEVIGGRGVLRADYDWTDDQVAKWHVTSVAVRVGGRLFLILLTYERRQPSPKETAIGEQALSQIVSSLSTEGGK